MRLLPGIWVSASLVVSSSFLVAASTRADALAPPPTNCPEGSYGTTSRRGEHCELGACGDECRSTFGNEPLVCSAVEIALCVETTSYPAADVQQGPRVVSLPAETWNVVHGPCAADGSCARGRCVRERACVPPGSSAARGGLCAASPGASTTVSAEWLAMLAAAAWLRRTRGGRTRG